VGTKADLTDMREYLALLLREGRRSVEAGISPGRAAATVELGKYASWTDPDRVVNNMVRIYSELKGTLGQDVDRDLSRQALTEYNQLKRRP
jgi:cyclase